MMSTEFVGEPDSQWTRGIPDYELEEIHSILEAAALEGPGWGDVNPVIISHLREELDRRARESGSA
jgi:hypothetical protein